MKARLDKEQYKKTLYLIGASSNLVTKDLLIAVKCRKDSLQWV